MLRRPRRITRRRMSTRSIRRGERISMEKTVRRRSKLSPSRVSHY
jgi:hypothetical protein